MSFLSAAAGPLGAAGAGVSAIGSIFGGISQANAASYSAQVAKNNAQIATQNAAYAGAAGEEQATAQGLKGAAKGGAIKAAQAANGIDVNSGSAVDVQQSERESSELDTQTVLNNAMLQTYGYQTQATSDQAQAALDQSQVGSDIAGGILGGAGSLLSGASATGFKWAGVGGGP